MQYERIKAFFEIVLNSEGTVLFHCTGGQDRTGIMSMLLLMVAHVDYCDIINDYLITSTYTSQDTRLQAFFPEGIAYGAGLFESGIRCSAESLWHD